jgi:MFS family permease
MQTKEKPNIFKLPRNVWAVSLASFFMDISSEMVINILPLYLANVLGVGTGIIGLIEGLAETTASILKLFSGWFSDKMHSRKWIAITGYALSAFSKPFFLFAGSWEIIAGTRWVDRIGKGIRTAPRDALVADSTTPEQRGISFGFHRAADTAGAMLGLILALGIVLATQASGIKIQLDTFRIIVLASLPPAFMAVLSLILGSKDVPVTDVRKAPKFAFSSLGKPFMIFLIIVGVFTLGNSSDAFLVLRAQNVGISLIGILVMLIIFNLIYTLISTPAGSLSDKIGRKRLIIGGWLVYAFIYLGFALAKVDWHIYVLYAIYGFYYGMAYGTANAYVADLVSAELRGTAYGTYNAMIGLLAFPASLIAGILWQGAGSWSGFGPSAPFFFGAALAFLASLLMLFWMPKEVIQKTNE